MGWNKFLDQDVVYECAYVKFSSVCLGFLNIDSDNNGGGIYARYLLDNAFLPCCDINVFEFTFDFVIIFNAAEEKKIYLIIFKLN